MPVNLLQIKNASERLKGVINPTPIIHSASLSKLVNKEVFLKLENLQKTGSFKIRGAYNKIYALPRKEKANGVVAVSSGNHAQGVALASTLIGIRSIIVMPETVAIVKHVATRGYGAQVVFHGKNIAEAFEFGMELAKEKKMPFIHPFEDDLVIAGQGTIGLEILKEAPWADTVIVPIGGGGLISGISTAIKSEKNSIKVIGVEAGASPSCIESLKAGKPVAVDSGKSIADGIIVKQVGEKTLSIIKKNVDDVVSVKEESIAAAILQTLERKKLIIEGAAAVTLAAALEGKLPVDSKKIVFVLSGGNIDVTILDRVLRIGLLKEGRVFRFTTMLTDAPGSLASLSAEVADLRANILQVAHQREAVDAPIGSAKIELILETEGPEHIERIRKVLGEMGYAMGE